MSRRMVFFITLFLSIGLGYYVFSKLESRSFKDNSLSNQLTIDAENKGAIEGSIGFPSETIPEEMEICAENIFTDEIFCTHEHIKSSKYTFRTGFMLFVPPGEYFVYAKLPNQNYKAFYSEFITCGLSVDCQSHDPIIVEVKAGQTVEGVDPYDWYARETF